MHRPVVSCTKIVLASLALAGCQPAVWDPQGPVGAAQQTILIDSLAIMLAIVVPTIVGDPRLRLVVPRLQHARALSARLGLFRPARADRLVDSRCWSSCSWAAWPGSARTSSIPRGRCASKDQPLEIAGRLARLEMAVHLPRPGQSPASTSWSSRPATPVHFCADLGQRDERLLRAAARQHDLHDERHGDAAEPAGRRAGHATRPVEPLQRRRLLRHAFRRRTRCRRDDFAAWVDGHARRRPGAGRRRLRGRWPSRA